MEFTKKDKKYLLEKIYGGIKRNFEEGLPQIEAAADVTTYELVKYANEGWQGEYKEKKITRLSAIRLLGREKWLAGLSRSAFHSTATSSLADGRRQVYFDSHNDFD